MVRARQWGNGLAVLAAALLLAPGPARAWPVDLVQDLEVDREQFLRLGSLSWFEVEDPKIATVEFNRVTGELILTAHAPGRTLLLLYTEGRFAVWRLRVAAPGKKPAPLQPSEAQRAEAKKACGRLGEGPELSLRVGDERCRRALLPLLETDAYLARELELTFEVPALQAQLKEIQGGISQVTGKRVTARYLGAGLELKGTLTEAEHRAVLWQVFRHSAGRPALDDGIEIEAAPESGVAQGTDGGVTR